MNVRDIKYQRDLIVRYKSGDKTALSELFLAYKPYIAKHVKRYQNKSDDLFQEGCIGLIEGIEAFNLEHEGHPFYYLSAYIRGKIKHYIVRTSSDVRTPYHKFWNSEHRARVVSIESPISDDVSLMDSIPESDVYLDQILESAMVNNAIRPLVNKIMGLLSKEEKRIIELRFIDGLSLRSVGAKAAEGIRDKDFCAENIRKWESKILKFLRKKLVSSPSYDEWILNNR